MALTVSEAQERLSEAIRDCELVEALRTVGVMPAMVAAVPMTKIRLYVDAAQLLRDEGMTEQHISSEAPKLVKAMQAVVPDLVMKVTEYYRVVTFDFEKVPGIEYDEDEWDYITDLWVDCDYVSPAYEYEE